MAVVANVNADLSRGGIEDRITEVARPEVELFPEPWSHVRDVVLAVLAEVLAVRIDHRGRVVVDAGDLLFINRHHHHHAVLLRDRLHGLNSGAVRNPLDHVVPERLLLGAKVRTVEQILEAQHLYAAASGFIDQRQMLVEHPLLDVVGRALERDVCLDLNQSATYDPRHEHSCQNCRTCNSISARKVCQETYNPRFRTCDNTEGTCLPTCRSPLRGFDFRIPFCYRRRRRQNPTAISSVRSRPDGAASSPKP